MKNSLKIERIYSDEHMIEVAISINTDNISTYTTCYIQIDKLKELNISCEQFIKFSKVFEWNIGSEDYSNFKMKVNPYDKRGNIKVDFIIINNKGINLFDRVYCECCMMLELGQIESLGKKILNLVDNDFSLVEIK